MPELSCSSSDAHESHAGSCAFSSGVVQHDVGVQVLADVNVALQDVMKTDDQNFSAAMPLNTVLWPGGQDL